MSDCSLTPSSHNIVAAEGFVSIPRDALFLLFFGPDCALFHSEIEASAKRVAAYTQSPAPLQLVYIARKSATHLRCVFISLLAADETLRENVVSGAVTLPAGVNVRVGGLEKHKAGRLFMDMTASVIEPWAAHENNSPLDLVKEFEQLYLVS